MKSILITILACASIMLFVDLFANYDSYIVNKIGFLKIVQITLLYLPEAIILVLAPATLFSLTYFLSQMYANREALILLSSGISIRKVYFPILLLSLILSVAFFFFSESIALKTKVERENIKKELLLNSTESNSQNITLRDSRNNYVIHSYYYNHQDKALFTVTLVKYNDDGMIEFRLDSPYAYWNEVNSDWVFDRAVINHLDNENNIISIEEIKGYENPKFNLEPNLFRNLSNDIKTLEFFTAINYLKQQKVVNVSEYNKTYTDFLDRVFSAFTLFIMASISLSIDYRNKKNIFLFAIISSVSIAVIYYVTKMIMQLFSRQGLIAPIYSILIPYMLVLIIPFLINKIGLFERNSGL